MESELPQDEQKLRWLHKSKLTCSAFPELQVSTGLFCPRKDNLGIKILVWIWLIIIEVRVWAASCDTSRGQWQQPHLQQQASSTPLEAQKARRTCCQQNCDPRAGSGQPAHVSSRMIQATDPSDGQVYKTVEKRLSRRETWRPALPVTYTAKKNPTPTSEYDWCFDLRQDILYLCHTRQARAKSVSFYLSQNWSYFRLKFWKSSPSL